MVWDFSVWDAVGGMGMLLIEASYLTQIVRLHQRKEAEDISLMFPGLNLLGRVLAMISSFFLGANVFVLGFFVGVILRATFFFQVVWYRHHTRIMGLQNVLVETDKVVAATALYTTEQS